MDKTKSTDSGAKNGSKFKSHDDRMTVVTPAGISIEGVSFQQAVAITRAMEALYGASIKMETQEIPSKPPCSSKQKSLKETEIEEIRKALMVNKGNKTEAAKDLGIHRNTLNQKIKAYGIQAQT